MPSRPAPPARQHRHLPRPQGGPPPAGPPPPAGAPSGRVASPRWHRRCCVPPRCLYGPHASSTPAAAPPCYRPASAARAAGGAWAWRGICPGGASWSLAPGGRGFGRAQRRGLGRAQRQGLDRAQRRGLGRAQRRGWGRGRGRERPPAAARAAAVCAAAPVCAPACSRRRPRCAVAAPGFPLLGLRSWPACCAAPPAPPSRGRPVARSGP
mmetsp:Transcript_7795/g.27384  ORF Transcript_7795/g.27384 Transcript_7795/m.27384 type:complete len:210 (-) Transcript_7795:1798-2427(-)